MKRLLPLLLSLAMTHTLLATEFHVASTGDDAHPGTPEAPLRTIQHAADLAQPGDTITVHAGTYRERVNPPRGGLSDANRITYQSAPNETVTITGSEPVKGWVKLKHDTWKVVIPNTVFNGFNPFADKIHGEWCNPTGRHTGMVYLNGQWFAESLKSDPVLQPPGKAPLWFADVEPQATTITAQFPDADPNQATVEINVRPSVFYPSQTGINFITVRGFELCQAATPWAGAMSEQVGLIGTHWSKGWIIENNHIHHSMCTGVTLGRYQLPAGQMPPATAPGFVTSIQYALRDGWSKEKIGSHIVRNNHIHHCEKNAVHGSLGASFSEISSNEIHDIARANWVRGADTGGIKFLGGVDMIIRDNHIYRCGDAAGIWLDWMAQGAVVTGNLLHDNNSRAGDIYFEMQHGPLVFANNILLSPKLAVVMNSEGIAFAHNLSVGVIRSISDPRGTPFHPAHALTIAGIYNACGGDHRFHNNILFGNWTGNHLSTAKLPSAASGNVFAGNAKPFSFGDATVPPQKLDAPPVLTQKADGWYLTFTADSAWRAVGPCRPVTSELLGKAKIADLPYENPDATPVRINTDYFGNTRSQSNPFPGPFEITRDGNQEFKVWPKTLSSTPANTRNP